MPLAGTEALLAQTMYAMVLKEMASDLAGPPPASPQATQQLQKLCTGLANAIVPHIVSMAQVAPGQVTVGSPASQVTTTPGILM